MQAISTGHNIHELFDKSAPEKAKNLKASISATTEQALAHETGKSKKDNWFKDHKTASNNYNKLADENGLFTDKHRGF
jgi:antitoxin CcdA